MRLEPWQLIKLKREYGGVYVIEYEGNVYACRTPTWLELTAQQDVRKAYNLSMNDIFVELQKQTLVYPENVEDVPEEQFQLLADAMAEDIPFTEDEVTATLETILQDTNLYRQIVLRLWQQMNGTTVDQIYNRPVKEVLEMYQTAEIVATLANEQQSQITSRQRYVSPEPTQQPTHVRAKPIVNTKSDVDLSQFIGKPLDEVLKYMAQKEGKK